MSLRRRISPRAGLLAGMLLVALVLLGTRQRPEFVPLSSLAPATDREPEGAGALRKKLKRAAPSDPYIVVDCKNNRIQLRTADKVLVDAACSTGSGKKLAHEESDRNWEFNTPQGQFRVQTKLKDPIWRKPDWAFIEEGQPIPTDESKRFESGSLGKYGLYFGEGYLIHGTLYERLLGRSVSHGCIRVGAEPLAAIYRAAPEGTAIFIH